MVPLLLVALTLTRPPSAYVDTGVRNVPLTISSWCWAAKCGAPIARARRVIVVRRGAIVTIHLRFTPTAIALNVGGKGAPWTLHDGMVSWRATRAGGLSLTATGVRGFVTYVGRIALRR